MTTWLEGVWLEDTWLDGVWLGMGAGAPAQQPAPAATISPGMYGRNPWLRLHGRVVEHAASGGLSFSGSAVVEVRLAKVPAVVEAQITAAPIFVLHEPDMAAAKAALSRARANEQRRQKVKRADALLLGIS